MPAIVKTFWSTFLAGFTIKAAHDIVVFIPPLLLELIIEFVESGASSSSLWKGVFFCIMLLLITSTQTLLLNQYFYKMYLVGMRMRSALTAAIYKKSLVISSYAKSNSSTGQIVNLMSVDVQRIVDTMVCQSSSFYAKKLFPFIFAFLFSRTSTWSGVLHFRFRVQCTSCGCS